MIQNYAYCKCIYVYFFQFILALKIRYYIFILRCKKSPFYG